MEEEEDDEMRGSGKVKQHVQTILMLFNNIGALK